MNEAAIRAAEERLNAMPPDMYDLVFQAGLEVMRQRLAADPKGPDAPTMRLMVNSFGQARSIPSDLRESLDALRRILALKPAEYAGPDADGLQKGYREALYDVRAAMEARVKPG